MEIDRDLKLAIGWNEFNLGLIGVWPAPELSFINSKGHLSIYRCLIAGFLMIIFIVGPQTANLFFIWGDIDLITENLATANIPVLIAFVKLVVVWYYREGLRSVLVAFYEDWYGPKTKKERATMLDNAKTARKMSIGCAMLTHTMVTIYVTLRIVELCGIDRFEYPQDRIVIHPSYFPYDVRPTPIYQLTCLGQIVSAYIAGTSYTGTDSFISMLVLHTCGQLSNLRAKLEKLMDDETECQKPEEFQRKLAWIVERHEHLNWFATTVENSFNVLMLIQMLLCTIQLCFQGFQFFRLLMEEEVEDSTFKIFFLVVFVATIIAHLYIYCYVGEMLLVQSSGMNDSAYESKWFNVSANKARCILFVMNRSLTPFRLTAGKFSTFSMEMFSTILRTAMGYLSFLLTVASNTD